MTSRQVNALLFSWLVDATLLSGSLLAASWLRRILPLGPYYPPAAVFPFYVYPLAIAIWTALFFGSDIYRPVRLGQHLKVERLVIVHLVGALLLAGLFYFIWRQFSRYLFIYFTILSLASFLIWRWIAWVYQVRIRREEPVRVAIIGTGPEALDIYSRIARSCELPPEIIGFISESNPTEILQLPAGAPLLGELNALPQLIATHRIREVVVALPTVTMYQLSQIASWLRESAVRLYLYLDLSCLVLASPDVRAGPMQLVDLRAPFLETHEYLIKRVLDLVLTSVFLLLLLPAMVLIGLAIRLDSPGPIILRQWRIGENGRRFAMFKFRSMFDGAEAQQGFVNEWLPNGDLIHKRPNDPRVTRVGRFLRRWSLDELPQLWNVLLGDMSLVGPRPELPWIVERYEPYDYRRLLVPPGLTGWWQINGRSDRPMHLCVKDDLYYIEHYSLWFDLMILLQTPFAVLRGRGAF